MGAGVCTESQLQHAIDKIMVQQANLESVVLSLSARLETFTLGVAAVASETWDAQELTGLLLEKQFNMRATFEAELKNLESIKDRLGTQVEMMKSGGSAGKMVLMHSAVDNLQQMAVGYLSAMMEHSCLMRTAGNEILGALDLLVAAVMPDESTVQGIVDKLASQHQPS